jgi:hypothetical protein
MKGGITNKVIKQLAFQDSQIYECPSSSITQIDSNDNVSDLSDFKKSKIDFK